MNLSTKRTGRDLCRILLCLLMAAPLQAELLTHLRLAGDLLDSGPGGNHGTFVGAPEPTFVPGPDGAENGGVSFDGVDDYVRLAQTTGLPLYNNPAFSITLWVKAPRQQDRRVFSEANEATGQGNPLYNISTDNTALASNSGVVDMFIRSDAGGTAGTVINHRKSARVAYDDTWHHIAWIDDNGAAALYVDGVLETATSFSYTRPALTVNTTTLGAIKRAAAGSFFTGAVSDVHIFTHALTEAEVHGVISSLFNCPPEGDSTCAGLLVDGPADGGVGNYTLTAAGADDSGDAPLLYTFKAESGEGAVLQRGPQLSDTAVFPLTVGTWTLTAQVDDDLYCYDSRPADVCSTMVVINPPPMLVSHWKFDGDLLDSEPAANHGAFFGGDAPTFTEGFDGNPQGAVLFDGVDDYVAVTQASGLPIYINKAYTVALWVKGLPQTDRRVFSEGFSGGNNNPLLNIGTDNAGATGQADIFIRSDTNVTLAGHRKSARSAFDDSWHHVAWVDDEGQAVLYIDGVRDAGDFRYTRGTLTLDRTSIGAILRATPGSFFAGAIDDVRVYNYALTAAEVSDLVPELPDCLADADTHCGGVSVAGPVRGGPGTYTATGEGLDVSGDPVLYTFVLSTAGGEFVRQIGPQTESTADFDLSPGSYDLVLSVDDIIRCKDEAADTQCQTSFTVLEPAPILISHWSLDGDLLDPESGNDGEFVGKPAPPFVQGYDCTAAGALEFDGAADYLLIQHNLDLPIILQKAFSIAVWVKGPPQVDRRVFSESSSTNRNPLFNIGTDNTGATGVVDLFIRDDGNSVRANHLKSVGVAFDDTWHHIAYTDVGGDAKLYIDGVLDPASFSYTPGTLTVDRTTMGAILRNDVCCWFKGRIDDVQILNFALSPEEVSAIFSGGPGDCCPESGDTHCQGLTVEGPPAGGAGDYTATASAVDDSGDGIIYTFTASNGIDAPMVIGPQSGSAAIFPIGGAPGSTAVWTFAVEVDDDPVCADEAADRLCSVERTVSVCPAAGDTHCRGLVSAGPEGNVPGSYQFTADAADDSGDPIAYLFTADRDGGDPEFTAGPGPAESAAFDLTEGTWTICVAVDDDACDDAAPDNRCCIEVTVNPAGRLRLPNDCNRDRQVDISDAVCLLGHLFLGDELDLDCGSESVQNPAVLAILDATGDDSIDISDPVKLLGHLFLGDPAPANGGLNECLLFQGCESDACP